MNMKATSIFVCTACAIAPLASLFAEEESAPSSAEAVKVDSELESEISYVQALIDGGFPDFAESVIAATKKRWPESEVRFFAIEIRGMLSLGKFEEAEKKIAALPDRKGSKYWAARLELANNYSARNRKDECRKIYSDFFNTFKQPTKELLSFYMNACYAWGQILVQDHNYEEAVKVYDNLLKQKLPIEQYCMMGCETCELYIRLATDAKDAKKREGYLAPAERLANEIIGHPEQSIYFGRAIAMLAHVQMLRGKLSVAQDIFEEFMPQLAELHEAIVNFDPDGRRGMRRFSPLPQCRFLMAKMLWEAAQQEYKDKKRDDEQVKSYLFGAKVGGKRNNQGAYNHALNVFLKYPESTWAAQAGELADEVEEFAINTYKAKIQKKVTPEMIANVRAMQFRAGAEKVADGDLAGGIAEYYTVLAQYPELPESIAAIEALIKAQHQQLLQEKNQKKKDEIRLDIDAIEGYVSERFSGNADRAVMIAGGDSTQRLSALERERGQVARAAELQRAFIVNYNEHPNAAAMAVRLADEAQKAERWEDALALWNLIGETFTNSVYYTTSIAQASTCYGKLGKTAEELATMKRYVETEKKTLNKLQAQIKLAQMYQKEGFAAMAKVDDIADPEEQNKALKSASAQIIRGIMQFQEFSKKVEPLISDKSLPEKDRAQYEKLREAAMFLVGECWSRLKKPEAKIESFRKNAVANMEEYVKVYPRGQYSKIAYVKLSMIYTALEDMEKSKLALDRLTKEFPDSDEAKNAKPSLAKSLIEMGLKREGTAIYEEMLRTDGAYTPLQYVSAGEALIAAKNWDLSDQAFDKAIRIAGTNHVSTVARARIGKAQALFKQKRYVEARDAIDLFLGNEKMSKLLIATDAYLLMVEVASEQGRTEKDDTMRGKHFGAAVGAVKKLRGYWRNKPIWEQDRVDLMSADVMISRMVAEESMGLKEQAMETCGKAAAMLQSFLQARCVSEEHPLDKMTAGELANLAACYEKMVPLFAKMGDEQADRVIKFGSEYLELFPNGAKRTEISNCINGARAASPATATVETKSNND